MKELEEIRLRNDAYQTYGGIKGDRHSAEDVPVLLAAIDNVLERCEHMDRSKPVGDWYYNEITGAIQRALGVQP